MAVPKQRKTKSRQGNRRSHHKLSRVSLVGCEKCGQLKLSHNICENCGTYKGREYVDVLKKMTRREKKAKEKELETQGQEAAPMSMEELSKK
ncbi:MAG: 50S ribosomal protein L32 [Candidatus Spechtbacterales bacterium]